MKLHLRLLLLIATFCLRLPAQNFQWVKQIGGNGAEAGFAMAFDPQGNIVSAGGFNYSGDFDPGPGVAKLTAAGQNDIYISKLDPNGNHLWVKQIGSRGFDAASAVQCDKAGNIVVSGMFEGTVDFDPGPGVFNLSTKGLSDIFYCKLDPTGKFLWAVSTGGSGSDRNQSLVLDSAGNVFATGVFSNTPDFDPGAGTHPITSVGNYDIYITRLDPAGNLVWATSVGGTGNERSGDICLDRQGNVYCSGTFYNAIDADPGPSSHPLTTKGDHSDALFAKLDPKGNLLWVKHFTGNNNTEGHSIAIHQSGETYLGLRFAGTVDLDPGAATYNVNAGSGQAAGIVKLDPKGNYVWAYPVTGGANVNPNGLAVQSNGEVVMGGSFSGAPDFDPGPGSQSLGWMGGEDLFLLRVDAYGKYVWAGAMGSSGTDITHAVAVDAKDNIYSTGYCSGNIDFDPGTSTWNANFLGGGNDAFVHKYGICTKPQPPRSTHRPNELLVCPGERLQLKASGIGLLTWHDAPAGGSVLGQGNTFTTPALMGSKTYFVQDSLCGSSGRTPIQVRVNPPSKGTISPTACGSYLSPSRHHVWTSSGTYMDTISNKGGCDSVLTIHLKIIPVNTQVSNNSPTLIAKATGATFQWISCDSTAIPGATQAVFTAVENGSYAVVVTQNGCSDTSACEKVILTRIPIANKGWRITPVPTTGWLQVLPSPQVNVERAWVRNIFGQQVVQIDAPLPPGPIDLFVPGPEGIYFLEIEATDGKLLRWRIPKQ